MVNKIFKTERYDNEFETFCVIEERSGKSTIYVKGEVMPLTYKNIKEFEIMLKLSHRTTEEYNTGSLNKLYN